MFFLKVVQQPITKGFYYSLVHNAGFLAPSSTRLQFDCGALYHCPMCTFSGEWGARPALFQWSDVVFSSVLVGRLVYTVGWNGSVFTTWEPGCEWKWGWGSIKSFGSAALVGASQHHFVWLGPDFGSNSTVFLFDCVYFRLLTGTVKTVRIRILFYWVGGVLWRG